MNIIKNEKITIRRPDDFHVHLRDKKILKKVLPYTSSIYGRAIIMPNLTPPITNIEESHKYRKRIMRALPSNHHFIPLMTCYLTDNTNPREIENGFLNNFFFAAKLYFKNSTNYTKNGVSNIFAISKTLEVMQKIGMPLLIHGEITDNDTDIFDREVKFIDIILEPLIKNYPELKIVFEHISTKIAVDYVIESNDFLAATVTPHHLFFNRNSLLNEKFLPYLFCLPILKEKKDQKALKKAVTSGNKKFFLGTDTAPHFYFCNKVCQIIKPGIFNAPSSILAYLKVFEEMNALKFFEKFSSENGANFYNLPLNKEKITFIHKPKRIDKIIKIEKKVSFPFLAGEVMNWSVIL
ncbi:dihydroorotase [Candidatus Tachikawaea gelatinosa]|uniref:Dihydroorotase n=1 Tax=Candidatus Tachikawaea gelatinosa TaxID=1410383 RepID=A0A090AL88_9ENTR|nr:dihydroorotase [Candidatus Tachikawaea gelatinosa]BAP58379.1 dihydroorotase [Candidatus Tachikawaea gelatinosa]